MKITNIQFHLCIGEKCILSSVVDVSAGVVEFVIDSFGLSEALEVECFSMNFFDVAVGCVA